MNYKIAQFIISPAQRNKSILEIFVAQPDANKEALAGKLFALFEIETNDSFGLKIINFLINCLSHNYYQNEKMILRERVSSVKVEHIFESALAKTNKKLAEFLQAEKAKFNVNILNITIGVVYNNSLHFASLGKNRALLLYKNKAEEKEQYKMADITEQTKGNGAEAKKQPSAMKLFSNVISGSVPSGGYFVFSSETLTEYLSARQLINIITTLPPAGAAEQIKNTLAKINAYVPFFGIIIKNTAGQEMAEIKTKTPPVSTKSSIENLIGTEEKTEKLLTPTGLINTKKWPASLNKIFNRLTFKKDNAGKPGFLLKDKIFSKKKSFWRSFLKALAGLKKIGFFCLNLIIYFLKIVTNKQALSELGSDITRKAKNAFLSALNFGRQTFFWHKGLNKINKTLFAVFLISLLAFSVNLGRINLKNKNIKNQAIINGLMAAIEQKENQIEASLLYDNEAGAGKLLSEVGELLNQLKPNSQMDQYQKLDVKYQAQKEKISRVVRLNLEELTNFSNLNNQATPQNIALANGKIYAADPSQSTIYSLEQANKLATSIDLKNTKTARLDYPSLDKNNNIYYLGQDKIYLLDIKSLAISGLNVNYGGELNKAFDLKQYNNRFYLADSGKNQIYRFNKSANELTGQTSWLSEKTDLSLAVSLDIDGNVYLLKGNGEVLMYAKGKKQDFNVSSIDPALSQTTKLIVSADKDYLYVLEPINKRVAVWLKDGKFVCQYRGDKLDNLKDFEIDEKNKKIFFLNGSIVYSAQMTHLK